MVQGLKISKRLTTVASFLSAGTYFADIGSDHAYLPCFICLQDHTARAIVGEINEGPYQMACKNVSVAKLDNVIDVRLGNGLDVLNNDNINELVMAGMGGSLINKILDDGQQKISSVQRMIIQPQNDARMIRKWFLNNGFDLTNERLIKENSHFYEILVAERNDGFNPYTEELLEKQLLFGPLLLKTRTKDFYQKWNNEYEHRSRIIAQMKQAEVKDNEKLKQFETELQWIKEVL